MKLVTLPYRKKTHFQVTLEKCFDFTSLVDSILRIIILRKNINLYSEALLLIIILVPLCLIQELHDRMKQTSTVLI